MAFLQNFLSKKKPTGDVPLAAGVGQDAPTLKSAEKSLPSMPPIPSAAQVTETVHPALSSARPTHCSPDRSTEHKVDSPPVVPTTEAPPSAAAAAAAAAAPTRPATELLPVPPALPATIMFETSYGRKTIHTAPIIYLCPKTQRIDTHTHLPLFLHQVINPLLFTQRDRFDRQRRFLCESTLTPLWNTVKMHEYADFFYKQQGIVRHDIVINHDCDFSTALIILKTLPRILGEFHDFFYRHQSGFVEFRIFIQNPQIFAPVNDK